MGIFGKSVLIVLYFIFLYRGVMIAYHAKDMTGSLIATGIVAMFAFHIFINIGMATGMMPVTILAVCLVWRFESMTNLIAVDCSSTSRCAGMSIDGHGSGGAFSFERDIVPLLPRVAKPARYTGGEYNSIVRPESECVCAGLPDVYEVGMSTSGWDTLRGSPVLRMCCRTGLSPLAGYGDMLGKRACRSGPRDKNLFSCASSG